MIVQEITVKTDEIQWGNNNICDELIKLRINTQQSTTYKHLVLLWEGCSNIAWWGCSCIKVSVSNKRAQRISSVERNHKEKIHLGLYTQVVENSWMELLNYQYSETFSQVLKVPAEM